MQKSCAALNNFRIVTHLVILITKESEILMICADRLNRRMNTASFNIPKNMDACVDNVCSVDNATPR